jgi:hypothetical protein
MREKDKGVLRRKGGTRTYINGDGNIQSIMRRPHFPIVIKFLCCIVAHHQRVLGQFLEEAFGCCAVDVKV